MIGLGTLAKLAAAATVSAAIVGGLYALHQRIDAQGYSRAQAHYTAAIAQLQAKAASELAAQTAAARSAEQALQSALQRQNKADTHAQQTIQNLSGRLRAATANGLRDPNANATCGRGSSSTSTQATTTAGAGAAHPSQTTGLLSEPLAGLLQQLTAEADAINAAYASCRADAQRLAR